MRGCELAAAFVQRQPDAELDLNANNSFNNARGIVRPPDRRNQYEAKVSDPIFIPKVYIGWNRTFFIFNYDGFYRKSPLNPTTTVRDAEFRNGNFSTPATVVSDPNTRLPFANNTSPTSRPGQSAVKILGVLPGSNSPGTLDAANSRRVNNFVLSTPQAGRLDDTTTRIDRNFSDRPRVFGFLNQSPSTALAVTSNSAGQPIFSSPGFGLITTARGARTTQLIARFDY